MPLNMAPDPATEDILHGVRVSDPYRWIEDRTLPETQQWVDAQGERCEAYFSGSDALDQLRGRVRAHLSSEVVDQPARVGGRCFYRRRDRGPEQASIYVLDAVTGREQLLVDPSAEGPFTSVEIYRISDDGSLLAFAVKHGGGDETEIRVVDVVSGHILSDCIARGYARGFVFAPNSNGFYYCHESQSRREDHQIRFHLISDKGRDRDVLSRERTAGSALSLIGDQVHLGAIWKHPLGKDIVCDLFVRCREREEDWHPIFVNRKQPLAPILHRGRIFLLSFENAPNGAILELTSDGDVLGTVIPEGDTPLRQFAISGESFVASFAGSDCTTIRSWTLAGEDNGHVEISSNGTLQLLPQLGPKENNVFFTCESFLKPPTIYEYTPAAHRSCQWNGSKSGPSLQACETRSFRYPSRAEAEIPITLIARETSAFSDMRPVLMTGYGGFGVPMTPKYSVLIGILTELGAVVALPHIRGGGEFGKIWHDAGRKRNRQTAIDDLLAAGDWLCSEGFACPSRLAIFGASNAGLLAAAAMTQRPDLFRAVLSIAPLLDMVRYERFDQAAKWRDEYGSVEIEQDFKALYAYSPYHRVQEDVNYPATFFVSGDSDDRCNPAHVRKMAARLQTRPTQTNPILVDYSRERGHSPVLPLSVRVEALARRLAFLCEELGIEVTSEDHNGVADC
jgi:prolyl oligopeptidase